MLSLNLILCRNCEVLVVIIYSLTYYRVLMLLKMFDMLLKVLQILSDIQNRLPEAAVKPAFAPDDELLDNADAKRLLNICDKTLYRWRQNKLIEWQVIGKKYYYRKSDLRRFL